jgi:HEAT repeat protein
MDDNNKRWVLLAAIGLLGCVAVAAWALTSQGGQLDSSVGGSESPTREADKLGEQTKQGNKEARVRLVELTTSPNTDVALAAVRNLGLQKTEEARTALEDVLTDRGRDERVRSAAAATLGKFKGGDPEPLTRVLEKEPSARVRRGAARGLAAWSGENATEAIPALYRALRDPDPTVRQWGYSGLRRATGLVFIYDPKEDPRTQGARLGTIRSQLSKLGYLN